MAPMKFGLFKTRSRDHQEQPSTENLLQSSSYDVPGSPVPSTSKGLYEDAAPVSVSMLTLDSDDDDIPSEAATPRGSRRGSCSTKPEAQINYELLQSQTSIDASSTSTLHEDFDHFDNCEPDEMHRRLELDPDGTSYDADSSEFDVTSITASDISIYCASLKKPKKSKSKEEQQLRDLDMWQASNVEVMQNLLSRSGTLDEKIKWEAIATARGLCTLTDSCSCSDCTTAKYLAGVGDGDGGLGAAPLLSAISVGCTLQ